MKPYDWTVLQCKLSASEYRTVINALRDRRSIDSTRGAARLRLSIVTMAIGFAETAFLSGQIADSTWKIDEGDCVPMIATFTIAGSNIMLAVANFSPMLLAVLLAWIVSVTIHEFSHALVAYIGGDQSMRDRGYLTLDPTKFIDPVMSLLLPAVVLFLGGFPLPGAAVPVDRSLLKNEKWEKLVSGAGPASNFVLFLLLALPLHPVFGLVDGDLANQPVWISFLAAMAYLNLFAVFLNLIPVPPLDGFGLIEHQFEPQVRETFHRNSFITLIALLMLFNISDVPMRAMSYMIRWVTVSLGFDWNVFAHGFNVTMFGVVPAY